MSEVVTAEQIEAFRTNVRDWHHASDGIACGTTDLLDHPTVSLVVGEGLDVRPTGHPDGIPRNLATGWGSRGYGRCTN